MIDQSTAQEVFRHLNFTPNEIKVYLAMLESCNTVPAAISRFSGIPRQKIYGILKQLADKGGCVQSTEARKQYIPVDPGILMEQAQESLRNLTVRAAELRKRLEMVYRAGALKPEASDNVSLLVNAVQISELIIRLMRSVEKEVLTFSLASRLDPALQKLDRVKVNHLNQTFINEVETAVEERKVVFNSLVSLKDLNIATIQARIDAPSELTNFKVRIVDDLHCRLNIFDRQDVLISLRDPSTKNYILKTLHIRDRGIAELLASSFYSIFDTATDIGEFNINELINGKVDTVKNGTRKEIKK